MTVFVNRNMEIKRDLHLNRLIESKHNGIIKIVTGIDVSFMKIVITESPTVRHQNDDGILFMDIYDFSSQPQ